MTNARIENLFYPELSYQIVGIFYKVQNGLGKGYQEKHVQRAVANALSSAEIKFQEQVMSILKLKDQIVGRYFLDFVIEGKMVVELKVLVG